MNCKFRILKDGGRVLWEITNRCNYRCKYCIFSSGCGHKEEELSLKDCKRVIDDLWLHHFKYLKITGGEPFLREDIIDIAEYAIEKGMKIDISTNASLITKQKVKKLSKLKLEMIHVSLDGDTKEIHEKIRGVGTYFPTIRVIEYLKESHQYIRIGTVLYKDNQNRILELIEKVKDLGVSEIIFSIMEPVGRMEGDYSYMITRDIKDIEEEIKFYQKQYKGKIKIQYNWNQEIDAHINACPAGKKFLYINDKGNIAPCSWLVALSSKYLTNRSLKDYSLDELFEDSNWIIHSKKGECQCSIQLEKQKN